MARTTRILSAYEAWRDRLITTSEAVEMADVDSAGELIAAARWAAARSGRSVRGTAARPVLHAPSDLRAQR